MLLEEKEEHEVVWVGREPEELEEASGGARLAGKEAESSIYEGVCPASSVELRS